MGRVKFESIWTKEERAYGIDILGLRILWMDPWDDRPCFRIVKRPVL